MASQINTAALDAEYPVAGVDNDSQGFRDNFSNIKDNLDFAKTEIDSLQENTAKTDGATNFNNNEVSNANFIATTDKSYTTPNVVDASEGALIRFVNGNYQNVTVGGEITVPLTLTDWPGNGSLAKIRITVAGDGANTTTINWQSEGNGTLRVDPNWPSTFTVQSDTAPKVVEFWTDTAGTIVYGMYLGEFTAI